VEFSAFVLIAFGFLAIVCVICTIILYPGLRDVIKELKKDS